MDSAADGADVHVGKWRDAPIDIPAGTSEFAVGDVHGEADLLRPLLERRDRIAPGAHLTFLGDLADRGTDSPGALRSALDHVLARPADTSFLPGNHEQMLLAATRGLRSPSYGDFMANGGRWLEENWRPREEPGAKALDRLLGPAAHAVLDQGGAMVGTGDAAAVLHRRTGNLVLVHAGVDPFAQDLAEWFALSRPMGTDDLHPLWIRDQFLSHPDPYPGGTFVVHGHTPEFRTIRSDGRRAPRGEHARDGWRLGLDGGSFMTGIVAAAVLEPGRYRTVTSRRREGRRIPAGASPDFP